MPRSPKYAASTATRNPASSLNPVTPKQTGAVASAVLAAFGAGAITVPDLAHNSVGLWFAAVSATVAGVLTAIGGMAGILRHRFPRILLAVATLFVALSYWLDVANLDDVGADIRRGAAFLLWPSLAWTAWSGIIYSRKAVAEAEATRTALLEAGDTDPTLDP